MSIYSNAVKRPLTTILIFIALVVMGIYSLNRLPVDLYPDMEFPFLTVFTSYPGASAADIETNVTNTLENSLSSLSNLKTITSTSSDNTSIMFIEFEWGTNTDEAANEIRDQLDFIKRFLPEDCEDPTLLKFNTSMMPILFYSVSAKESYAGIEKILDEKVVNPLNRIEGVGSVGIAGSPGREIYVDVDPIKLEAYNLTVEQIGNILRMENMNMPAGFLEMGNLDYPLRIQGEFKDSYVINDLVVGSFNGNSIYLRDIATVTDSKKESKAEEKINGELGVRMYVQKQSGGNTVRVAEEVRVVLEELKMELPADIQIETIFDSSDFIQGSIGNLTSTLMYAMIFVVLVVLFFLGRWRATFIVIITIPISLIVAFIYLAISGNSINIISLASLSIAIGMVVDDAIVVLENITKHIEKGSSPREAAIYATNEVWMAVIVTTLAIVAVFFPLTFVQGLTGQFFKQLGMIVTLTTVTSTVAAITLTPTLSSLMLKVRAKKGKAGRFSYENTIKRLLDRFDGFYEDTLRWSLRHKKVILIASLLIFAGSISLMTQVGAELMPEADQSSMGATIELQTGTRVSETKALAARIDKLLMDKFPEIKLISTSTGSDEEANFATMFSSTGTHTILYNFTLSDLEERERSVWDLAEALRAELDEFPEIVNYQVTTGESGMGAMMGNNIEVEVYGYDLVKTNIVAKELAEKMSKIPGATDIQVSRDASKPELQIELDQNKMILHGLNTATVSTAIKNRVDGMTATRLRESGDEYDVIVRYNEESRNTITDIQNIPISNMQGQIVRLGEIAEIFEYWSPPNIEHKRKERIVSVTAVPFKRPLGEVGGDIQKVIDEMDIPAGVSVEVSGAVEDMMESMADLALLLVISLLLVYLVMASQFESLKMPFIIMFSIPFAFSGVAIALYLTDTTFSLVAGIGAIMLVGIVVKNAIVLVDYINLMRDRGLELIEAVAVSGRSRLRPVLMTSLTTILAMLPLAISSGEGSEIWSPMGIAVIGGLVFSTLVTLVLVPVVYVLFSRRGERNKKRGNLGQYSFLQLNNESE
jgi:HAE1 family hydrophobic/amphiphilic exporter-1